MNFTLRRVDTSSVIIASAIQTMFDEVFSPHEWTGTPGFQHGWWWVAFHGKEAAGFSGMVPTELVYGALYIRATGVLPKFRGHSLQSRLYRAHEKFARAKGYSRIVTDTICDNAASMNSLIACGYKDIQPNTALGFRARGILEERIMSDNKPATLGDLQDLHRLVAKSLNHRIQQDMDDEIPTDAATLGAAIKFLKDNSVSADPADAEDLNGLREKLRKQADDRNTRRGNVLSLVNADLKEATGG